MRGRVAGTHRRQRPSSPPGRGAVWVGFFLLLAVVALTLSHNFWLEAVRSLFTTERRPLPQGTVLWQTACPPDALVAVNSRGELLVAHRAPDTSDHAPKVTLRRVTSSDETVVTVESGSLLALAYRNREASSDDSPEELEDWRCVIVRSQASFGQDDSGGLPGLSEQLVWVGYEGGGGEPFTLLGAVATSADLWVDGFRVVIGLYRPDTGTGAQSVVMAVDELGREQWSRPVDRAPVHRVVSRPGSGFVAVATPGSFALLDVRGNLLWSKNMRSKVSDLAVQSHGGPAVISGKRLLVYDRRGNLLWKKDAAGVLTAVACAGHRIAVAHGATVTMYDEEGLARWSLTCYSEVVRLELDAEAGLVAVVLDTGTVLVVRGPSTTP